MRLIGSGLLPLESSLLVHELRIAVIIITCEVPRRIRLHLVVVPGEGAEAVGIVSLVEHLHGRTADYGINVACPMVEVTLLFSVPVEDRRYGYRLLLLEESQDGLDGSVAYSKLLSKEGDLYRAFASVHADIVLDDGETFVGSRLPHFPERYSAFLPSSDIHEAMVVLRLVVVSDYGWVFLSHIDSILSDMGEILLRFKDKSLFFTEPNLHIKFNQIFIALFVNFHIVMSTR